MTRGQTLHPLEALTGPQEELDVNVTDFNARVVVVTRRKCLRGSQTHKTFTFETFPPGPLGNLGSWPRSGSPRLLKVACGGHWSASPPLPGYLQCVFSPLSILCAVPLA